MGPDVLSALSEQTSELNGTGLVLTTDPDRRARLWALYVAATEAIITDTPSRRRRFPGFATTELRSISTATDSPSMVKVWAN
jgi:hypothetical protein